nr:pyruvate dehydrogenase [Nakamurella alba]
MREIVDRAIWLSTVMVDHANRDRADPSGLKVGGHQASSASIATIMTTLWMHHLRPEDRVSVKPHASPMLHALEFLLGALEARHMTTLRQFGGLQSYPSRTKDPVPADYSTGSVGIGATATIWGAIARRYVNGRFDAGGSGRQWALVGDAELDEGAVWEAVLDPMVAGLGEIVWVVDLNRQSLDRVLPGSGADRLAGMFAAAGWQVLPVKYGGLLTSLFDGPGGQALRRRLDGMSNAEYQRFLRHKAEDVRSLLPGVDGTDAADIVAATAALADSELLAALRDLGGHDVAALSAAFDLIDDTRPTVVLAWTVKGHGLATEGHPQNHSALLTPAQLDALAARVGGVTRADPWQRFDPRSPAGRLCDRAATRLARTPGSPVRPPAVPTDLGRTPGGTGTTQAALGRTLLDLRRAAPEVGARVVTVSPDVSSSTNLAGWLNKVGIWSPDPQRNWFTDDPETILHWREQQHGQHIELGIAEANLVGAIGELGATWSRWGAPILPIGVLYDPFVTRALEPWSYGIYAGGQSILVGTPSGVTLAAEGGAHQSVLTPSIGLELPGCTTWEPAFVQDAEWCLLAALGGLGRSDGRSAYLRLSTRPIEQALARIPAEPAARERRRRHVVAGAYALQRSAAPVVTLVGMGAVVPEVLSAAATLDVMGFPCDVLCVTAPGELFRAVQARRGRTSAESWILDSVFPANRARPMVTVVDGHPHTLAFLAGIHRVAAVHLGVTDFGQSGDLASVYAHHGLDSGSVVAAALDLVD